MSGVSYTRTDGVPSQRDSTFPRFHMEPVHDPVASEAAGRPIYHQQERIQFIQPGNPNQPVSIVTEEHRQRWPEQYAAFRRGEDKVVDGTPLSQWSYLTRAHVMELNGLQIFTVEQCAGLSDTAVQKIGMGGMRIRQMANAYLDEADQMKITSAALDRAERAEARLAGLERQAEESKGLVERLYSELMALKNAPNPIESYIPGMHNSLDRGGMVTAQSSSQPSSLDGLGEIVRRRGPPPGSKNHPQEEATL